jgi:alcohol dehydrogenase class IV
MTFSFRTSMNLKCGAGIVSTLGAEMRGLGFGRLVFVTDPGLRASGVVDKALESLSQAGVDFQVFDGVEPNPKDITVENAWETLKSANPDAVIGFGGGSAMDAAKAMAVLARNPGHLRDYDGTGKIGNETLPVIAVPTTAGTGSEVTSNAAITDAKRKYKMSLRSPSLIPCLAMLDPTLLATLPRRIAAESSMDAIIHAAESLVSNKANLVSEALAIQALDYLCPSIRPFVAARNNALVAERMLVGSMLAGTVIGNTGTGADHALGRALGGMYDLPHGLACSLMFPYVVRFNFIASPKKYRLFASKLGLDVSRHHDSMLCDMLVDELFRLCADLGIPTRLSEVGLSDIAVGDLAEIAQKNSGPNPRETTVKDLEALLEQAA